jgi:hypothetical protein
MHESFWEEDMIRLNGEDAVNQAYRSENCGKTPGGTHLFVDRDGIKIPVALNQVLDRVLRGQGFPRDLACEVPSVWEMLLLAERNGTLSVHPCPNTVLVFSREYGAELGCGVRCLAVRLPVFEAATNWAMRAPVIDPEYDRDEFVVRLHPRMLLRRRAWQKDVDLLRFATEIAEALAGIFRLGASTVQDALEGDKEVRDDATPVRRGRYLDAVLGCVRAKLERDPGRSPVLRTSA